MAVPEDDYALVAFELFMLFGAVRGIFCCQTSTQGPCDVLMRKLSLSASAILPLPLPRRRLADVTRRSGLFHSRIEIPPPLNDFEVVVAFLRCVSLY